MFQVTEELDEFELIQEMKLTIGHVTETNLCAPANESSTESGSSDKVDAVKDVANESTLMKKASNQFLIACGEKLIPEHRTALEKPSLRTKQTIVKSGRVAVKAVLQTTAAPNNSSEW